MISLKKMIASLCAVSMLAVSMMIPAMAALNDSYSFNLVSSEDNESGEGAAYLTLTTDGFDGTDAYTVAGQTTFNITPAGVIDDAEAITLGSANADGLYAPKSVGGNGNRNTAPTFDVQIAHKDGYDVLTIQWYGAKVFRTDTGKILDIALYYVDEEQEITITPDHSIPARFMAKATEADKTVLAEYVPINTAAYEPYTLTADYQLTQGSPAPAVEWVTADVQDFSSEVDNSVAVAAKATLENESDDAFDTVTWKVTKDEVVKGRRSALKTVLDGPGTVTVGLAIGGITSDGLTVEAALGAQGN